jgi:hypothetical protein
MQWAIEKARISIVRTVASSFFGEVQLEPSGLRLSLKLRTDNQELKLGSLRQASAMGQHDTHLPSLDIS